MSDKPIVEFICLKGRPTVGKRCYLIPLVKNTIGTITPAPIHVPRLVKQYSRMHFETADTIYIHYTAGVDPFVDYNPSQQLLEQRLEEYFQSERTPTPRVIQSRRDSQKARNSARRAISMRKSTLSSAVENPTEPTQ